MQNERRQLLRSLGGVGAAAVGGAILLKPTSVEAHHLPPYIDVRDYASVQDALNVAGPGIAVFFPAGNYYLSAQLTVSNKAVTLLGAGVRVSNLVWTGGGGGLVFSSAATVVAEPLTISGLSFLTTAAGGGTAITASWGNASPTALFSDFSIGGMDPKTQYWTAGIHLYNAKGGKISRFFIEGKDLANDLDPAIRGEANSTPLYVSDGDIYSVNAGVVHVGSEGLHVSHCEIVNCNYGIVRYGLGPNGACPGTTINSKSLQLQNNVHLHADERRH